MRIKIFLLSFLLLSSAAFATEEGWRQKFEAQHTARVERAFANDAAFVEEMKGNVKVITADFDFSPLMRNTDILLVGEYHGESIFAREVNIIIKSLASKNLITHYATEFFTEDEQDLINEYEQGKTTLADVKKKIKVASAVENLLVANRYKIKTIGLEPNRAQWDYGWALSKEGVTERNEYWLRVLKEATTGAKDPKFLLYCGSTHSDYTTSDTSTLPVLLKKDKTKFKVIRFVRRDNSDMPWVDFMRDIGLQDNYVLISVPVKYRALGNADYIYYVPFKDKEKTPEEKAKLEKVMNSVPESELMNFLNHCTTDPDHPFCKMYNELEKGKSPVKNK